MGLKHELRFATKTSPFLLRSAWQLRKPLAAVRLMGQQGKLRRVVERGQDVVIDGYPRSANTFACKAFLAAQGGLLDDPQAQGLVKMGCHMHAPAQFILAKRYGIPAMLLLRDPVAAALSWMVFTHEKDVSSAWLGSYRGQDAATTALRDWIRFHEPLLTIKDAFVVAPFEEVTSDFAQSIRRLNAKFGTYFVPFEHTEAAQAAIFQNLQELVQARGRKRGVDLSRTYHFPHEQKQEMRKRFVAEFETAEIAPLRESAGSLFRELMSLV